MDPYADASRFYEAEFQDAEADIAGYARRGVGGPLLVIGCGTGRVCRGLEATRPVVGLDRSEAMLAVARAHPRAGGTRYVRGEAESFDLGVFDEVIVPNGTFNFLPTRATQLACLRSVRAALAAGAPATFDLVMPDFQLLAHLHTPEAPAWVGRVDGVAVVRTREVFRDPVRGTLRLVDRFRVEGGPVHTSTLALRLVFPNEAEWLFEAAGFYVDAMFGDHRGGPLVPGCDRLLIRAIPI